MKNQEKRISAYLWPEVAGWVERKALEHETSKSDIIHHIVTNAMRGDPPLFPFEGIKLTTKIISRYNVKEEEDVMRKALGVLLFKEEVVIKSIFCDSKATALYEIEISAFPDYDFIYTIIKKLNHALIALQGWHNGIDITYEGKSVIDWPADGFLGDFMESESL